MKAIVITMLVVEAAVFIVAIVATLFARSAGRRRPIWTSVSAALIIVAAGANVIGDHHSGQPGADVLQAGAMGLLGMAIMAVLMALRLRRGLT
jgi:quinol-cytochrome oxidoreductase complex cytochrome b subunit